MTPKPKDLNPSGLGRAIINRKVKDARIKQESGLYASDIDASNRLKSVTQERDLDEFLNSAQLAGKEFTAERRNVRVIQQSTSATLNPYLLSEQEERSTLKKHAENKQRLRVPRRPPWTKSMTTTELDKQEKAAFLDWRRGLALLQEEEKFLLTPFERNIEVWRQLWRVLERSHLVVQIVDGRNPLRFRCEDLEKYVQDVEGTEGEAGTGKGIRRNVLLINKADLLTVEQRRLWADYFDLQRVQYAFFSAANAVVLQQKRRDTTATIDPVSNIEHEKYDSHIDSHPGESESVSENESINEVSDASSDPVHNNDNTLDNQDIRTRILSVSELENWFIEMAPDLSAFTDLDGRSPSRLVVGLVGYPNVGKSSTINSLLGEKKVSVSSTPGKTKHFQTIQLSDSIILCDCPGLVFPQFATTKADLVCDGVLPIDQLREYTGPTTLVVRRIPKRVLEAVYGLALEVISTDEGNAGEITAESLLIAHAIARGYTRSGQGNPDEARSARYILKDYVNGKLLFCHPPPGITETSFNHQTHERSLARASGKKRAPVTRVGKIANTFVPPNLPESGSESSSIPLTSESGQKSQIFDQKFFESNPMPSSHPFIQSSRYTQENYSRTTLYPHQIAVANDGTPLGTGNFIRAAREASKHHKKLKRVKHRSGKGYD